MPHSRGTLPGRDEHERLVQCGLFNAGIEDDLGYLNNIPRQSAVANRILGDEFQKCWISKIVPAFECDVLMHKIRMLVQVGTQTRDVTRIQKFHRATKRHVFNSLMMRQIQLIRERWLSNVLFQSRPAPKSILSSDCELRVTEA